MELQLGLALPAQNPMQGFNLTSHGLEGSELRRSSFCIESHRHVKNKRRFEESFGHSSKTLPLLVWNGQPNEEDDGGGKRNRNTHPENENNEEENRLVGWPPIKSWRKKKIHQHPRVPIRNDRMLAENGNRGSNSLFVKVKMEGVAIGRKIDLRLYISYETLTHKLISMFHKYHKLDEDKASYTLMYQDEEGDWLVAGGDVPWQSFIHSAKRLEIVRSGVEESTNSK